MILALLPILGSQFNFGGPTKVVPPRLRLELRQVGPARGGTVRLSINFTNAGGGILKIDPVLVSSDLTQFLFRNPNTWREVVPTRGRELAYFPLDPTKAFGLGPGFHYGYDQEFKLPRNAVGLDVFVGTGYPEEKAKGLVWSGFTWSNTVRIGNVQKDAVPAK